MSTSAGSAEQLFAQAIYEIRQLLSSHLGAQSDSPLEVRNAAHLAHALHNLALASIEGNTVDVSAATRPLQAVDDMFGTDYSARLRALQADGV
jgi:hypothetical protein